ncbi:ThuA domain-containing protein [Mucilaginibacter ginsenosidivorax]|uniref:ThuA domain-containing protein n=1 Tax=Mucilaginibacter ginsenosidivorax TaxID=862126 RepID=A0A5B8W823_9SPHI|nr:ThuA domain-containing protein [Mucilaginibacter ginsenosidivorax]QEC79913.1 ThuA domain-containing protein [Mucilaginibacter ginsenosidivorax]
MKKLIIICLLTGLAIIDAAAKTKVLVFCKTAGFHHNSIAVGVPAIMKLGAENGFAVDSTTNAEKFTTANLKQYAAVIFLSTTGDVLNDAQQTAFEQYIKAGGGFVGVHAATDTEYDWAWYGKLVGAYFKSHPKQQEAVLHVVDRDFIATKHLPEDWKRWDEWYNYKWIADDLHVLIKIDEKSYTGGENGDNHPMAWYHSFDGGRAFYTELGHTDESYADPLYLKHLLGGIQYAIGKK